MYTTKCTNNDVQELHREVELLVSKGYEKVGIVCVQNLQKWCRHTKISRRITTDFRSN